MLSDEEIEENSFSFMIEIIRFLDKKDQIEEFITHAYSLSEEVKSDFIKLSREVVEGLNVPR